MTAETGSERSAEVAGARDGGGSRARRRSSVLLLHSAPAELAAEVTELERLLVSCESAEKQKSLQAAITKRKRIMLEQQLGVAMSRPDEIKREEFDIPTVPGSPPARPSAAARALSRE